MQTRPGGSMNLVADPLKILSARVPAARGHPETMDQHYGIRLLHSNGASLLRHTDRRGTQSSVHVSARAVPERRAVESLPDAAGVLQLDDPLRAEVLGSRPVR